MPLTREQITHNINSLESQGAPQADIQSYLDSLKETKEPGFLKSLVQGIAKPFLRTGLTAANAVKGLGAIATKDVESLQEAGDVSGKDFGFWGEIAPYTEISEAVGAGLEIGGILAGGGATKQIAQTGFKQFAGIGAKVGLKAGARSGSLIGAGQALQEDPSLTGVAKGTALGGGLGALGGGVLGAAFGLAGAGLRGARVPIQTGLDLARKGIQKGTEIGRKISGATRRAGEGFAEVPGRIAQRTAEGVEALATRQKALQAATPHIRQAMEQGIPNPDIKFLQAGSKIDKLQRVEMLNIAKKATEDLTFIGRAVQKVGESIVKGPVQHLIKTKNIAIKETTNVLNSLSTKSQDTTLIFNQFVKDMSSIGLNFNKQGKGTIARGGRVLSEDVPFYQAIFEKIRPLTKKGFFPIKEGAKTRLTYKEMHSIRQFLFDKFDIAKARLQPFSDNASRYAQNVRFALGETIDRAANGSYGRAQQKTAESMTSLGNMAKFLGYKGKIENITSKDLKAGESFMRVFGNASDRPIDVLNKVMTVAKKYGYSKDENILLQLRFADMLENIYGMPSRSIGGQISRATQVAQDPQQVIAGGIREAVKWSPYSAAIRILRTSGLLGRRPEDIIKAFENVVRTEAGIKLPPPPDLGKAVKGIIKEGKGVIERARGRFGL